MKTRIIRNFGRRGKDAGPNPQGNRKVGLPGKRFCSLPRMTLMHANAGAWAWVLIWSWHRLPDPRRRRALATVSPRAAFTAGCLSERARTASHYSALIWRLKLWAIHPFHSTEEAPLGTFVRGLSRTLASKKDSMERAGSQNGGRRRSPGTPPRTGRREASRTAILRMSPTCRAGDSHSRALALFAANEVLQFSSCMYRRDFAFALP